MKRILFVDDEPALLDGLRGRLRGMRSRWDMVFVESGARAVTEMELHPADVVVADIRMPGMNGAELLTIVRDRWPETIRMVLSGYAEEEQSARLVPVAHQYISKPCDAQFIENVISRCVELHNLLHEPGLRAVVGRIKNLPAMPRTYAKLRAAMERADASVREVSNIIYEDAAIAAKVLQVVNSAFFRLARRISNIEQAVAYLGFNAIRTLAMSIEVFAQWKRNSVLDDILQPEQLQERAHQVAVAARSLSQGTKMGDDALLAGLFHNIGYWVMLQECPQQVALAVQSAHTQRVPLHQAERQVIGASHAEIGAYLLGLWGLPYSVIEAVAFQHTPQRVGQTHFDVLAALVIAQRLIPHKPLAEGVGEGPDIAIDEHYLQTLNAPFDWAEAQRRVAQTDGDSQA